MKHQAPLSSFQGNSTFQPSKTSLKVGIWSFFGIWMLEFGAFLSLPAEPTREYQLKAVFLYNFTQFIEWPTNAFENKESPLVLGVLGSDPFGALLEETVRNEQVQGRRLELKRYRTLAEIKTCHILYIGQSEARRLDRALEGLKGKPVLTVSDIAGSVLRGVMIEFVTERNRVRLRINPEAAKGSGLTLSSKLLRASEVVSSP